MNLHPSIKIIVVLFSFSLASCIVWQTSSHMSNSNPQMHRKPATENTPSPVIISTKNPAGAIRLEDSKELQNLFPKPSPKNNQDFENKKTNRPLLPSSKSAPIRVPQHQKTKTAKQQKNRDNTWTSQ